MMILRINDIHYIFNVLGNLLNLIRINFSKVILYFFSLNTSNNSLGIRITLFEEIQIVDITDFSLKRTPFSYLVEFKETS